MMKKIIALVAALMLIATAACAEWVEGQQDNWLIAKVDGKYAKVAEILSPEGFAPLEGVTPNGDEPELYFVPEDSENPVRFFYYTTGYGEPATLAENARQTFAIYYDDCVASELADATVVGRSCTYFHYTCSYATEQGDAAYEQSLIAYFPIDDACFAACIISLYVEDSESFLSEEELYDYLNAAASAIVFEN